MFHDLWVVSSHICLLQIEKISNRSNLWQFIHKTRAGPEFWPGFSLLRSNILSTSIGLPCFITPEWFPAIYAFSRPKKYLNRSNLMAIYTESTDWGPNIDPISVSQGPMFSIRVLVCHASWLMSGFQPYMPFTDRKNMKSVQFYRNLYLKLGLGRTL